MLCVVCCLFVVWCLVCGVLMVCVWWLLFGVRCLVFGVRGLVFGVGVLAC